MIAAVVFWVSVALVIYAYAGYALTLAALARVRRRDVRRAPITPTVTFIITAHNEEARLPDKIANTLAEDYPDGLMDVIVASDCSTDGTDRIAQSHGARVRLVRAAERRGKEAAQQLAIRSATGEILVFSDVATALPPDAVRTIVQNFADDTVGCVSSVDRFVDADGRPSGEGAYVRYEMWLRQLETRANTLVGLSGSFFAVRRELCDRWSPDRQSDFTTVLNSVDRGRRGVLDPASAGYYRNIVDDRREFQRKVRTVTRGLAVLATHRRLLNPFRHGLFAWQLASHKLCRWLVPFALVAAAGANAALIDRSPVYAALWGLQLAFYAAAAAGIWTRAAWLRVPAFFVLSNAAIAVAWYRFLRGERFSVWNPSERVTKLPTAGAR